jgi:hypothetical protein
MYNLERLADDLKAWGHNADYRKVCGNINADADVAVVNNGHTRTTFTKVLLV